MTRYKLSFISTLFISLVVYLNYHLDLFWNSVVPLMLYFLLTIVWGLLLSEYSRQEFVHSLVKQFFNLFSLFVAGFMIVHIADNYDIHSRILHFILVVITFFIIRGIINLLKGWEKNTSMNCPSLNTGFV